MHCYNDQYHAKLLHVLDLLRSWSLRPRRPASVQTATIDGAQLLKDLQTLSADDMEGRLPGTPGGAKARAYILRRFKEAGIQPIGDSYERPFTFRGRGDSSDRGGVNIVGVVRGTSRAGPLPCRDGALRSPGRAQRSGLQRCGRQRLGRRGAAGGRRPGQRQQARALGGVRGARCGGVRAERGEGFHERSARRTRGDRDEREPRHGRPRREEPPFRHGDLPVSVPQGVSQGRRACRPWCCVSGTTARTPRKTTGRRTRTTILSTRRAYPSSTSASKTKRSTTRRPTMPRR